VLTCCIIWGSFIICCAMDIICGSFIRDARPAGPPIWFIACCTAGLFIMPGGRPPIAPAPPAAPASSTTPVATEEEEEEEEEPPAEGEEGVLIFFNLFLA
jgi:hypothetical protein